MSRLKGVVDWGSVWGSSPSWQSQTGRVWVAAQWVQEAAELARRILNEQRKALCPERPSLQLLRILAAARQPAEGQVWRLQLEIREDSRRNCTDGCGWLLFRWSTELEEFGEKSGSFEEQILVSYALDTEVPQEMALSAETGPSGHRRMTLAVSKPPGLDLPDDFDPRLEKTLCFPRGLSRRQGSCGASWAFASTAVASFRECLTLLHQGEQPASLNFFSAQELVSCSAHHGCSGGSAAEAFYYMKQRGIARENCSPYRMRCFHDQSTISMQAADFETLGQNSSSCAGADGRSPLGFDSRGGENAWGTTPSASHRYRIAIGERAGDKGTVQDK
eukprot:g27817.t1